MGQLKLESMLRDRRQFIVQVTGVSDDGLPKQSDEWKYFAAIKSRRQRGRNALTSRRPDGTQLLEDFAATADNRGDDVSVCPNTPGSRSNDSKQSFCTLAHRHLTALITGLPNGPAFVLLAGVCRRRRLSSSVGVCNTPRPAGRRLPPRRPGDDVTPPPV